MKQNRRRRRERNFARGREEGERERDDNFLGRKEGIFLKNYDLIHILNIYEICNK